MSLQDTVFEIVKDKGPVLPAEIVSEVSRRTNQQRDMFFIGAILSELISAGNVKMTYAKIGGSRLYYTKGQEERLEKLYDYLNDKEKRAYELLKEKKILRSSEQEPVIRVALSQLKDFSKPIEVKLDETETFWRWHLFPVDDAKKMIEEMVSNEINAMKEKGNQKNGAPHMEAVNQKDEGDEKRVHPQEKEVHDDGLEKNKDEKPEDTLVTKKNQETFITQKEQEKKEKQSRLYDKDTGDDDQFMQNVKGFLESRSVKIISSGLVRKNSECEFEVETDSSLGKIRMYAFAKSKKKLNENDLGYAYVRAKNRNLELCFISPGELTKKAKDMLNDELRSIVFLSMR
ncbi:MAG: hypothetical protein ACLFTR_02735 [Candidatus Woesearchaeota archaeon]